MARLNRNSNRKTQAATPNFTVHKDREDGLGGSDLEPGPVKSRSRRTRSRNAQTRSNGNSSDEKSDDIGDDGALSTRLSSLKLNGQHGQRHGGKKSPEQNVQSSNSEEDVPVTSKKGKARRALGSTQANPLLLPLPSTSSQNERRSEECANSSDVGSETWRERGDYDPFSSAWSPEGEKEHETKERTPTTAPREAGRATRTERKPVDRTQFSDYEDETSEDGFDSLDDFIVGDDEDISYVQDSDEELTEDEKEVIIKPKTPRRLFRGVRPESARGGGTSDNNTSSRSSLEREIVLHPSAFDIRDRSSEFLDLQPSTRNERCQNTPVKKPCAEFMDFTIPSEKPSASPSKPNAGETRCVTPPTSPSKPRLQSPSKTRNRIPESPHRPSIDAFWNQEIINEWNDGHSPRKTPQARRGLQKFGIFSDEEGGEDGNGSPTGSPTKSANRNPTKQALAAARKASKAARKEFDSKKASLAEAFLQELDHLVADGEIQRLSAPTGGVKIIWSRTLNKTAGRANWKRQAPKQNNKQSPSLDTPTTSSSPQKAGQPRHAYIELAEKVVDCEHRLYNTLAHEYCHLADFMISNVRDNPHGASFKRWAKKCQAALRSHPAYGVHDIKITTKHSYAINYKYLWCCKECGHEYGRHSKSIDPKKCRCGVCTTGHLVQVRPMPRKTKSPSAEENKENREPVVSKTTEGNVNYLTEALGLL